MRINFDAKHDHEAINDEGENEKEVGHITESLPERQKAFKASEAVSTTFSGGVFGICWLDEAMPLEVVVDMSNVLFSTGWGI